MARPFKKGLSYFPLDVKFFDDPKIQELIMEVGYLGIVVYLRILTLVYQEGYYLEISVQSLARLIFRDIRGQNLTKVDRVIEVIYRIAECELIDSNLVAKGIITSSSIEKQWLISTARRRNIDKSKYWLLTQEEEQEALKCTKSSMSESARIMSKFINVDNNTQNKKENKIDKKDKYRIKDNQTIKEKKVGTPILNYYTTVLIDNNFISLYDLDIAEYNYFLGELATHYNYRKILSAIKYTIAEIKKRQDNIDDKFAYFKKSILNGLERLDNLEKPIEKNLNKLFGFEEEQ